MKTTIYSATNGQPMPGTSSNILMRMGKPVTNGRGEPITDDRWIYVTDRNGSYAINVIRSEYCQKLSLMNISIIDSIGGKKMTKRLQNFIEKVGSTLVFEKFGKSYRVYLRKVGYKYDLAKVMPYWATTTMGCNKMIGRLYAHQISVDIESTFYVNIEK